MKEKEIGLYIHIPFCKSKCSYCDFCSYENKENLIPEYIKCLKEEILEVANANKQDVKEKKDIPFLVNTIYIGGGTPSHINSNYIIEIMETIKQNYNVDKNAEITIEVNPGTVTFDKLQDYFKSGINRISIGLQSTYNYLLEQIGRIHTYQDFLDAYHLAREAGFENINVDLMLGLPNQTLQEIENSVQEVIGLEPEHISLYSLIIEEGTKLAQKLEKSEIELPEDELERKMYWKTKEILEQNGYVHYEISNFAKDGYASRHNTNCWEQKEYIGFGAGAHSYTNGVRYSNTGKVEEYIKNYELGQSENNFILQEKQNKEAMQKEYIMLGLRKIEGISVQEFKNKYVENPIYIYHKELEKLVTEDLLEIDGDRIKLTDKGLDLATLVWQEFI